MRNNLQLTTILFLVILICQAVFAQNQQQPSPQMLAANDLYKAQKWAEAAKAFEIVLKDEPNNSNAWSLLATSYYFLKQYPQSVEAFQKNIAITDSGFSMFNLASVYSVMGEKDKAIEWLTKSANHPKMFLPWLDFNSPDLMNIKEDSRFKALEEKVNRQVRPCLYRPEAKQFDFWVGEWDVFNPQGRKDGTNNVQKISEGCAVLENWTNTFGGSGKSLNFYDAEAGKWFQYWMGADGTPIRYSGVYQTGKIIFESEKTDKEGKKTLVRLTFFNLDANTVRQFSESSSDGGKTWTTVYDYKYVRRNPSKNTSLIK